MNAPPVQHEPAVEYPRGEEDKSRNFSGWIAVGALCLFIAGVTALGSSDEAAKKKVATTVVHHAAKAAHNPEIPNIFFYAFLGASIAIWMQLWQRHKNGTLGALGIPMDRITAHDADRLALRSAQIFAIFMITQLIAAVVFFGMKTGLSEVDLIALAGVLTVLALFGLQRLPVDGKLIYVSSLGVKKDNLRQLVGIGVLGFIAELPVSLLLSAISLVVFRGLSSATHPATTALEQSHSLRTVIPTLLAGSIIAPFWEEIVFRGMLFPGLKRLLGGILPAMIVSSFLFASVHPQGVTLWIPLAFIGATSCFLSYQTRSLIPGIVMHCLHNTAMFVLVLMS